MEQNNLFNTPNILRICTSRIYSECTPEAHLNFPVRISRMLSIAASQAGRGRSEANRGESNGLILHACPTIFHASTIRLSFRDLFPNFDCLFVCLLFCHFGASRLPRPKQRDTKEINQSGFKTNDFWNKRDQNVLCMYIRCVLGCRISKI